VAAATFAKDAVREVEEGAFDEEALANHGGW